MCGWYTSDMSETTARDLLARALNLPPSERLDLVTELLKSVEGPEEEVWSGAWLTELDKRMGDAERDGDDEDWNAVRARVSRELRTR